MNHSPNDRVKGKSDATLAALLQPILAEECSLFVRTRFYCRNVRGPNSPSLQKLFEDQGRQIDHWLAQLLQSTRVAGDSISEGIDGLSLAAVMTESAHVDVPAPQMIQDLLRRHDLLSRLLRAAAAPWRDLPTVQLLQRLADFHVNAAWILRVVVSGPGPVGLEENYFCSAPDPSGRV